MVPRRRTKPNQDAKGKKQNCKKSTGSVWRLERVGKIVEVSCGEIHTETEISDDVGWYSLVSRDFSF